MQAVAITLRADEPHAFLRNRFRVFLRAAEHDWMTVLGGFYVEVSDSEPDPAFVLGRFRYGGMGTHRPDVECCVRVLGFGSGGIEAPPPPPCPIFD